MNEHGSHKLFYYFSYFFLILYFIIFISFFYFISSFIIHSYTPNSSLTTDISTLGFPLIPALVQLITLPFCPESPSWLYIIRGDIKSSRAALSWFGNAFNVERQLRCYQLEIEELEQRPKVSPIINTDVWYWSYSSRHRLIL